MFIDVLLVLLLIVVLIQNRRMRLDLRQYDPFLESLTRQKNLFYMKDIELDTELFNLECMGESYHSLQDFLRIFCNSHELQKAISGHSEERSFLLIGKNNGAYVSACLCNLSQSRVMIIFNDLSLYLSFFRSLEQESDNTFATNQMLSELLENSGVFYYYRNSSHEIFNAKYSEIRNYIPIPNRSGRFSFELKGRHYVIDLKISDDSIVVLGQENDAIVLLTRKLESYSQRISAWLGATVEKVIVLDQNGKKIISSRKLTSDKRLEETIIQRMSNLRDIVTATVFKMEYEKREINLEVLPHTTETTVIVRD